jgi:undecaprenyl diphosphate synthase
MSDPRHIAIIMDGNGRWAKARGLPRSAGHRAGVEALRETVRAAGDRGLGYLTLFAFSSENWSRPSGEVNDLLGLLKLFIRRDLADLHRNNVKVSIIGEREGLTDDIRGLLTEAETLTRRNTGLNLVIAFNYGSRADLGQSRYCFHARPGPHHPHQRRDASVEFSALAGCLCGVPVYAGALAGFPSGRS